MDSVDVLRQLGLQYRQGELHSVVVVATSRGARGRVELVADGYVVAQAQLGSRLESVQLNLERRLGIDLRSLELRTQSVSMIALLGATVSDHPLPTYPPVPPRPTPGPIRNRLTFQGQIEDVAVLFEGLSHDEIFQSCRSFLDRSRITSVDDVTVFGRRHTNSGWWSRDGACAIAALNARSTLGYAQVLIEGSIEAAPFRIEQDSLVDVTNAAAVRLVETYAPLVLGTGNADQIAVNGRAYTTANWWSARAVATILSYTFARTGGYLRAEGTIEGAPFLFTGHHSEDIRGQCLDYFRGAELGNVDDIVVNGQRRSASGWWGADQACMTIASLSR